MVQMSYWTSVFVPLDPSPGEVDPRAFNCDFYWDAVLVEPLHSTSHDTNVSIPQPDRRHLLLVLSFPDHQGSGLA